MITNISLVSVYCLDQDAGRLLRRQSRLRGTHDVTMGDGFRWLIVGHPGMGNTGRRVPACRSAGPAPTLAT